MFYGFYHIFMVIKGMVYYGLLLYQHMVMISPINYFQQLVKTVLYTLAAHEFRKASALQQRHADL